MPDSAFIRSVARDFGGALALTSANPSGGLSSVSTLEFKDLWPSCAAVFEGGVLQPDRRGSTVVDLSQSGSYCVIREGSARKRVASVAATYGLLER